MSINNYLFGPLHSEYCLYFYILSISMFILMVSAFFTIAYLLLTGSKKMDSHLLYTSTIGLAIYAGLYFQNRLLHSMCMKSADLPIVHNHSF